MNQNVCNPNLIIVTEDAVGRRIDNFLLMYLKGISKSKVYCMLRKGEVRVNRRRIKFMYRLNFGDVIRIPPMMVLETKRTVLKLSETIYKKLDDAFIYEDDYLIILNKPSGMAVHGGSGLSFSVIDCLRVIRPELSFLKLVHRLDRDTSGILLLAKDYFTLLQLNKQLCSNNIKKEYLALVSGRCDFSINVVIAPLIKNFFSTGIRTVSVNLIIGKYAKTHFIVKERFVSSTLLKVYPITGRTHQIRVHAQHMGYPIVFDRIYGDLFFDQKIKFRGVKRLFLHAFKLEFLHPNNGKVFHVKAPIDHLLLDCLSFLRN